MRPLLIFTGMIWSLPTTLIGLTVGGLGLLIDPSGGKIQMPVDMLQHSPFPDFFWPGLILFAVLGIGSLVAAWGVIRRVRNYPYWIIFTGSALGIWICTQMVMIQGVSWLHALYGGIGLALLVLGWLERKEKS